MKIKLQVINVLMIPCMIFSLMFIQTETQYHMLLGAIFAVMAFNINEDAVNYCQKLLDRK